MPRSVPNPSGFIEPCQPSRVARPPSGAQWIHEIKHDGYRLMVRRDGDRVRCFTKNGHDWTDRFPAIAEAATRLPTPSFLIDGEAVVLNDDGTPNFNALRGRGRGGEVILVAFDLLERSDNDLRKRPLLYRKQQLRRLIGKSITWRAIQYGDHLKGDGTMIFDHVCQLGLEGIVSKRMDAPYRSGPSKTWLKSKNPASAAVRREREEEWG